MPEETAGELYAKISADNEDFKRDIDEVYDRLDKLEEKDVSIQAETKGVESSVGGLGAELSALGGTLTTVFHYLQQTSGGLQAMTDMATGLIGAGIDTFLIEVMIPLWDKLKEAIVGNDDATSELSNKQEKWATQLELTNEGLLRFKDYTQWGNEKMSDFRLELEAGKVQVDEYGNAIFKVGEMFYYYDGATGQYLGRTKELKTAVSDLNADFLITKDLIGDVSERYGVLASDVELYVTGGKSAIEELWAAEPSQFKGSKYLEDVATAAEAVRVELGTLLVQLGINPMTGKRDITAGMKIEAQLMYGGSYGDPEKIAQYLLSGGN